MILQPFYSPINIQNVSKFKTLEEAQTAFDDLQKENQDQENIISDLRSKLAVSEAKAKTSDKVVFELDKKKYAVDAKKFIGPDKKEYKAEDLLKNKELAKALIELEVGFISEIK